ncbi:hypothetical protein EGW08_003048 [Elysia chlorotica]|uniref:Translation initiation factor 3 C-terminal domain-containing protein n=1 Tax=Elysia chlorotica TaxID=188477 RepID=A0A433U5P3_ELYCH|nr:hypothetical protein EGW08_003048 [Elysia chlorotica]
MMACQFVRCLNMQLKVRIGKNAVFYSSCHLYMDRAKKTCSIRNSCNTVPRTFCLPLKQTLLLQHPNPIFPQREQFSILSRCMSSKADNVQRFDNKDKCAVFDQSGMLIKETTFVQAKLLAASKNSRLVFMNKNPDGLLCFSLQQLTVKPEKAKTIEQNTSKLSKEKKSDNKAAAKEYKIKASIADHDLNIKISQMQSHLGKGKQVIIFIKEKASQTSVSAKGVAELMKKLKDELSDVCKVNQDYSNATTTKLTLTPKESQPQALSSNYSEENKVASQ